MRKPTPVTTSIITALRRVDAERARRSSAVPMPLAVDTSSQCHAVPRELVHAALVAFVHAARARRASTKASSDGEERAADRRERHQAHGVLAEALAEDAVDERAQQRAAQDDGEQREVRRAGTSFERRPSAAQFFEQVGFVACAPIFGRR